MDRKWETANRAHHILLGSYDVMHGSGKCIDWEGSNVCVSKSTELGVTPDSIARHFKFVT
jgi:hypothetical protein